MRKIAENKALEAYPEVPSPYYGDEQDMNLKYRFGFIQGYDQAMQDFLEKAEEFFYDRFNIHPHDCHVVQYVSDTPLENMDDFVEQFKNYIENESKD